MLANLLKQNLNQEFIYSNQNYLAVGLSIPWDQLTTYSVTGIVNLDDSGFILAGAVNAQLTDNLGLQGQLNMIGGDNGTEFWTMGKGARLSITLEAKYFF